MLKMVLCLTNTVAADLTANAVLAVGGRPAMMEDPGEAACLAAQAGAVLVNVGTLNAAQALVMKAAVRVCAEKRIPWVLDPVACHLLAYRRQFLGELFAITLPALVRGNHAEIDFLRASEYGALLAKVPMLSTGAEDRIWTGAGDDCEKVTGGTAMLEQVTAAGCAQGALCAEYLARGLDALAAARAVSKLVKRAGERALARAEGPGTFRAHFIDELAKGQAI